MKQNNDNDGGSGIPKMRHTGSSFTAALSWSDDDESQLESQIDHRQQRREATNTFTQSKEDHLSVFWASFCHNGLPWKGAQCRSIRSGASGILYALPAFTCSCPVERAAWIIQSILSVLADYVFAGRASPVHGVDRVFAVSMLIIITFRAWSRLQWWALAIAVIPCSFFVAARHAKKVNNLEQWKWCHLGWHLSGGLLATMVIDAIHNCPTGESAWATICP